MKIETREQYFRALKELDRIYTGWETDSDLTPVPVFDERRMTELEEATLEFERKHGFQTAEQ